MRPCRDVLPRPGVPISLLLLLPATAEAQAAAEAAAPRLPFAALGVLVLVALLAWGLARYAGALRADFVRLAAEASPSERLAAFRECPAGLPEGSVRAALAVAIVLLCLPALVLSNALGLGGTGELGTVLGGVLGFYFGTRNGGDAESARREARTARAAQEGSDRAAAQAAAARDAATTEASRATREAAAAGARARDDAAAGAGLTGLAARAAEAVAVARALGALLPAGPGSAVLDGAGAAVAAASRAAPALDAALADPTPERIAAAVEAAGAALAEAGEGTELAARLGGALEVARAASEAAGLLRAAMSDPGTERLPDALAAAAKVAEGTADAGLGAALAPALGAIGTALRIPGLAVGAATPVGVAAAVLLGAWQAASAGRAHYQRWMARVLDRPVSRDLFPGGEWDGEAARAVIAASPSLAAALAPRLSPEAPQGAAAEALRRLLDPGAGAWLHAENPAAFASETEAEAAVAALRRTLLEAELDRADARPVPLGAGLALPQAVLRADLDRLREAGAGEALDTLALVADGLLGARDAPPDTPALMRRALEAAAARGRALERDPAEGTP